MRSFVAAGILGMASVLMAAPAVARTQTITLNPTPEGDGSLSSSISSNNIARGSFQDIFNFNLPSMGVSAISFINNAASARTNIDFTSAALLGPDMMRQALTLGRSGTLDFGGGTFDVASGLYSLEVNGTSGGNGSYGGEISFTPAAMAGVPEPSVWALMMLGFGGLGFAMRRRKALVRTKVRFA